jgi:hypothetical protein
VSFLDEFDGGFGWMADEFLRRTSHALSADGGVWIIDPVDAPGVEERVRALGEPRGVIQLLDRHSRDSGEVASRLGVPHHEVPRASVGPFQFLPIRSSRWWQEVALWWPERRVLVCADALGTIGYFRATKERIGLHPLVRPLPPKSLGDVAPKRILVGHGPGIHDDAAAALDEAMRTARSRLPAALWGAVRRRERR